MEKVIELYYAVRNQFPEITTKADREHIKIWDEIDPEYAYSWFHSLANALNAEMAKAVDYNTHDKLFTFISDVSTDCSNEVYNCIDVSFVENLFWQIPETQAKLYWHKLPKPLKELYLTFYHHDPF